MLVNASKILPFHNRVHHAQAIHPRLSGSCQGLHICRVRCSAGGDGHRHVVNGLPTVLHVLAAVVTTNISKAPLAVCKNSA